MALILSLVIVGVGLIGWAVWHYILAPYVDLGADMDEWDF